MNTQIHEKKRRKVIFGWFGQKRKGTLIGLLLNDTVVFKYLF